MAVGINADGANIPSVNLVEQGSDPATPASGHTQLYVKGGILYLRDDAGTVTAVGAVPTLAEGQLAIGDGSDELSALALGTEGDVVTADANGMATWAAPAAGGGGDMELIAETVVGSGGVASVDWQNIPGTYRSLLMTYTGRSEANATSDGLYARFNNDSGSNYSQQGHQAYGTQHYLEFLTSQTSFQIGALAGATAAAGLCGSGFARILGYAGTTFHKQAVVQCLVVAALSSGNTFIQTFASHWASTAAITRITIFAANGDIAEGSQLALYGLKTA